MKIADELVAEKLAACVQLVNPITSIYHWQGKITKSTEYLCLIKTSRDKYKAIEARINELHPYDIPEIIALDISEIDPKYSGWITDSILS